jgi:hypothetical protein
MKDITATEKLINEFIIWNYDSDNKMSKKEFIDYLNSKYYIVKYGKK